MGAGAQAGIEIVEKSTNDRMADAMAAVIEGKQALAAAEERNRLALDLHDTAKQRAIARNLQLTALREVNRRNAVGAGLADIAWSLTYQLQQDFTGIIRRLTAPTIAEAGYRPVLLDGVEMLLADSGITDDRRPIRLMEGLHVDCH
jgi:signal transduction histidine kinase